MIEFDYWGTKKKLIVPDAKYRSSAAYGLHNIDVPGTINIQTSVYIGGSAIDPKSPVPAISDADLQSRLGDYRKDKTGRENCDILMAYNDRTDSLGTKGVPAVAFCRSLNIPGFGTAYFDLPNAYELSVIFAESDNLDSMDKSAAANPGNMLGMAATRCRFYFAGSNVNNALSSTEYNVDFCVGMHMYGWLNNLYRTALASTIPCRAFCM